MPAAATRSAITRYVWSTLSMTGGLIGHTVGLVLLAKALGPAQFGIFTIITTASNFGLVWCGLGSGEAMRRLIARDRAAYPRAAGHALTLLAATGVLASLAVVAVMTRYVPVNAVSIGLLVVSNILLFAWSGFSEQILLAHGNVTGANIINMGSGFARAGMVAVACLGFGVADIQTYAYWHFGYYAVLSLYCVGAVARYGRPQLCLLRDELLRGATISFAGLFIMLRQNADVLALSAVASPTVVGIYAVARRIVGTASVVSASLDRLVYSSFARAGRNGPAATLALARHYMVYATALCLAASLALYVMAPLVPMIFSRSYADSVPLVRLLSWTILLTSLQFLASDALNACDRHEARLAAEVTGGLIGVAALAALTYAFGLDGIVASIYVAGLTVAATLWGTLVILARRSQRDSRPPLPTTPDLYATR